MALFNQNSGSKTGAGTNATPSLASVTAGRSLVLQIGGGGMTDSLPTDSSGQTWSKAHFTTFSTVNCATYYLLNANAGAHNLTWALGANASVGVQYNLYEASPYTAVDIIGTALTGTGASTGQTPTVTTTFANDGLFAFCSLDCSTGSANNHLTNPPAGWTAGSAQVDTLVNYGVGLAYQEVTSTGAYTAPFVYDSDTMNARMAMIVSFKLAGAPALTAVSATGSLGSITIGVGVQLNLSGASSTGSAGTAKANVSIALTGVAATGSVGTVSAGPPILGNVTATGSAGTAVANAQLNLSGTSATGAVSNVGAGSSVVLSSSSSVGSTGAVGPTFDHPLTGVTGTCSVGSVGAGLARALAAVSSTTSLTSVGANISVALTGVSSTCSVGNVQAPGTLLGPVTATGAVGQLGLTVAHALSSTSGTLSPGSVQSTPQRAISGVAGTGSVGTVTFGNVIVGLAGVTATGSAGTVLGPVRPDTANGELFAAQQMAQPFTYTNMLPVRNQRGAILYDSGSWTVPLGAVSVFVSATAAGGTPRGRAGEQVFHESLPVQPGQLINVNFLPNGDVSLYVGSTLLLYLFAGPAGGKDAWQSTLGQQSGIPGDFGSGVDAGRAHPPIVVLFWSPA